MTQTLVWARRVLDRLQRAGTRPTPSPPASKRVAERAQVEELFARHPHRRLFGIRAAVVEFDGATYFVPRYAAHRPTAKAILLGNYTVPELHRFVATVMERRPGSMVHAGTFFGDMLPSFSRKTTGSVYAFEPVLQNYLLARATMVESELHNVILIHAGLGAGTGLATLETRGEGGRHRGGASYVVTDLSKRMFAPQLTTLLAIDQFAIDDLSLIQLDVEGYELPVLEGALKTIKKRQPVIVIEDDRRNCLDFLATLGYSSVARIGRDQVYLAEADAAAFKDLWPLRRSDA